MDDLLVYVFQEDKISRDAACRRNLRAAKKAAEDDTIDLEALQDVEDSGLDLNLVMSAARMHRLRHNAGGPQVHSPIRQPSRMFLHFAGAARLNLPNLAA